MSKSTTTRTSRSNNNASRGNRSRSSRSPNKLKRDGQVPNTKWKIKQSNPIPVPPLAYRVNPQLSHQQRIKQHKQRMKKKKAIVKDIIFLEGEWTWYIYSKELSTEF